MGHAGPGKPQENQTCGHSAGASKKNMFFPLGTNIKPRRSLASSLLEKFGRGKQTCPNVLNSARSTPLRPLMWIFCPDRPFMVFGGTMGAPAAVGFFPTAGFAMGRDSPVAAASNCRTRCLPYTLQEKNESGSVSPASSKVPPCWGLTKPFPERAKQPAIEMRLRSARKAGLPGSPDRMSPLSGQSPFNGLRTDAAGHVLYPPQPSGQERKLIPFARFQAPPHPCPCRPATNPRLPRSRHARFPRSKLPIICFRARKSPAQVFEARQKHAAMRKPRCHR